MQELLPCPTGRSTQLDETEISALCAWSDTLDAWVAELDDAIVRWNGARFVARHGDVTYLQIDDLGQGKQIEEAVCDFIRTSRWPKLSFSQLRLLLLRAFRAHRLLVAVLDDELELSQFAPALPADLGDRPGMIRWLFIETWKATDAQCRNAITTDFVRSRLGAAS